MTAWPRADSISAAPGNLGIVHLNGGLVTLLRVQVSFELGDGADVEVAATPSYLS